ncbi:hypothetical protein HF086_006624 [Spodoptera exigua]|uniref:Proteasome subunit beta n=1 Tax=Spodoptera exigua TaxID=7107 RepID=A0A922M738_SPOEX|nr:hypothetical protein HF086_006624 [Spodoptera exigua]
MSNASLFLQCLIGMQCKDFAIIAADQTNTQSIIVMKHDENKFYDMSDHLVMGIIGAPGDRAQFAQFIAKNVQLYKMRNGYQLTTAATVHFTRKTLMEALKTGVEMTEEEAYEVIKQCIREVHSRLFVSLPNFLVKVINKDGIKEMPIVTPATYILQAQA